MSKSVKTLLLFLTLLGLSACESNPTKAVSGKIIELHNQTDQQATNTLVRVLLDEGYEAKKVTDSQFIIFYDKHTFVMEPKLVKGGLSRIVVSRVVGIKPEFRHSPELFAMVVALNRKLNFAKFSLLPKGQGGQVQASITFINERVSIEEIKQFMLWLDESLAKVRLMMPPDVVNMIEPEIVPGH